MNLKVILPAGFITISAGAALAGGSGGDLDVNTLFMQAWEAAKLAGPFGTMLMFAMWWRADAERVKLQTERDALLERVLTSINAVGEAIRDNTRAMLFIRPSAVMQPPPDFVSK